MNGDVYLLLGYGAVQGVVDITFAPLAQAQPETFKMLIGPPVTLPSIQGCVLAALWVTAGLTLGAIDALNPYDIKRTRGIGPVAAATVALGPWFASCSLMMLLLAGLDVGFHLGPGLSAAETDFLIGSYVVMAGWRVIFDSALPRI